MTCNHIPLKSVIKFTFQMFPKSKAHLLKSTAMKSETDAKNV